MNINWAAIGLAAALLALALPSCKKQNHRPDAPTAPSGPDSAAIGDTLTFTASAVDSDGDSVAIRFDWGDGDTSAWSDLAVSGESVTMTHSWRDSGSYSVRAQSETKPIPSPPGQPPT